MTKAERVPGPFVPVRNEFGAWLICPLSWGEPVEREAVAKVFTPNYHPDGIAAADLEAARVALLFAASPGLLVALGVVESMLARLENSQGYSEDGASEWLGPIVAEIRKATAPAVAAARGRA